MKLALFYYEIGNVSYVGNMKRKEAIIRYLGNIGRGSRDQIAEQIRASPELTSVKLTELKRVGMVRNVEWVDGSKVWILTQEGDRRFQYYGYRERGA